jgi:hypothetical protein
MDKPVPGLNPARTPNALTGVTAYRDRTEVPVILISGGHNPFARPPPPQPFGILDTDVYAEVFGSVSDPNAAPRDVQAISVAFRIARGRGRRFSFPRDAFPMRGQP